MSDAAPVPPGADRRRRRAARAWARAGFVSAAVVAVLAVLAAGLYLNRRAAARQALVGWLERQGVRAEVEVERFELDGFVGRIRIGDPRDPDFAVERVEVDYALAGPWSAGGAGATVSRVRLLRPVLKARWVNGELSFGSLDPVIDRFAARPPRPDAAQPIVIVETGRLRMETEYGPFQVLGDARLEDGKLMRLSARMPTASLKSGETEGRGVGGAVEAATVGDRLGVRLALEAERFAGPGARGEGARLTLTGDLPYPDLERRRGDGRARLQARVTGDRFGLGAVDAAGAALDLRFDGAVAGWLESFRLDGRTATRLTARRLTGPALAATEATLDAAGAAVVARDGRGLGWRIEAPARVTARTAEAGGLRLAGARVSVSRLAAGGRAGDWEAVGPATLSADRAAFGELTLRGVSGRFDLDVVQAGAVSVDLEGGLAAAGGAWPLLGPPSREDPPELAAMKRALGDFSLSAPRLSLEAGSGGIVVALNRPATVTPANGGRLDIRPAATPAFLAAAGETGGGALSLASVPGGGLPELAVAVPEWRLTPDGFTARIDGEARLDFAPAEGLEIATAGRLTSGRGGVAYAPDGCVAVTAVRLELGENDAEALSGRLCPAAGPLVSVSDGGWTVRGALRDGAAATPFLQMRFADIAGPLEVSSRGGPISLRLEAERARVLDAAATRRFNPLEARGEAALADERWTGGFDVARGGRPLGRVALSHDGRAEAGGLEIEVPELAFAEGGLQPGDLSPLVEDFVRPPVTGSAGFQGRFDWSPDSQTSAGLLTVPGLDFDSPAGRVTGLSGQIAFSSLAPLTTAPDQRLRAARVETVAPLTDLSAVFSLTEGGLSLTTGELRAGGGGVSLEPTTIPFDNSGFSGVLVLNDIQFGEVLDGAGLGDRVRLDAVVSGRLPFRVGPDGSWRIAGGSLYATRPGRLSIQREALSGLEAGGGGEAVPPGMVQDLAYQAMENLAFDELTAAVDSQDEGRLRLLFHILGRHDPPRRQELRLSLAELISREFLNRELPLPSDTGIDLTLDTTFNVDQLVSDLLAIQRARDGEAVTPAP